VDGGRHVAGTVAAATGFSIRQNAKIGEEPEMLTRLSKRTNDLMRRAIDAVDKDTADLITTLVASAFVDGGKEALARNREADPERELEDA
jgi:hypothetical protein